MAHYGVSGWHEVLLALLLLNLKIPVMLKMLSEAWMVGPSVADVPE